MSGLALVVSVEQAGTARSVTTVRLTAVVATRTRIGELTSWC
ncbi:MULTISPECIES: hypothetical protein [unclassified Streptomyces]